MNDTDVTSPDERADGTLDDSGAEALQPDVAAADEAGRGPEDEAGAAPVPSPAAQEPEAPAERVLALELVRVVDALGALTRQVAGDQDVIARMQARIEALQDDQVRALLTPAVLRLAALRADFAASAERDYARLEPERVRREFTLLGDQVDDAIARLGAEPVGAEAGEPFDPRRHTAVRRVPTADPALDRTIASVLQQGYTFDPTRTPALYARVTVHSYQAPPDLGPPVAPVDA